MKAYTIDQLFYTRWDQLSPAVIIRVAILHQEYKVAKDNPDAELNQGLLIIQILRSLRKNWRLVDKIDEAQAVDIFNALDFISTPWYFFPKLKWGIRPTDLLSRTTFDQFIYGDHEFTMYLATGKAGHLDRLVATLYATSFDKESVEDDAAVVSRRLKDWHRQLVFLTYANVRSAVINRCKHLLPPAVASEDEPKVKASGPMWHLLKHEVAKTGVFGTFDQVGTSNMYSVLDHLELLAKQKANANA